MEHQRITVTNILLDQARQALASGTFETAINILSSAINLDSNNGELHCELANAKCQVKKYEGALEDAMKCLNLQPVASHCKAYNVLGQAYTGLGQPEAARKAYEDEARALELQQQQEIAAATAPSQQAAASAPAEPAMPAAGASSPPASSQEGPILPAAAGDALPASDAMPTSREALCAEAVKAKEAGNEAYKRRDFEAALLHYNRAMQLDDADISFLTNRAAVYFETHKFEACVEDCMQAVERGRELRADVKLMAKALARKGGALTQLGRFEEAIQALYQSLVEHRTPETVKKLSDAEKMLQDKKDKEYVNLEKCSVEKDKGDELFKQDKFIEAVVAYKEALRRGPPTANPEAYKVYSNLAACYTKLEKHSEGLVAAEQCISLQPTLATGYSRKANLQMSMKDYHKALVTFKAGLKLDPGNQEFTLGQQCCKEIMVKYNNGEVPQADVDQRAQKAARDPEVLMLMRDPEVLAALQDFQSDPKRASETHLKNNALKAKLDRLISAGAIQMQQSKETSKRLQEP